MDEKFQKRSKYRQTNTSAYRNCVLREIPERAQRMHKRVRCGGDDTSAGALVQRRCRIGYLLSCARILECARAACWRARLTSHSHLNTRVNPLIVLERVGQTRPETCSATGRRRMHRRLCRPCLCLSSLALPSPPCLLSRLCLDLGMSSGCRS